MGNLNRKDKTPNLCFITLIRVINCFFFMLLDVLDHNTCLFFCATLIISVTSKPTDSGSVGWSKYLQSPPVSSLFSCKSILKLWQFIRHHMAAHQTTFGLTESLRQKKLLVQNAETDGLRKNKQTKKKDILKSNKQIIISVACFLYDIVPFLTL